MHMCIFCISTVLSGIFAQNIIDKGLNKELKMTLNKQTFQNKLKPFKALFKAILHSLYHQKIVEIENFDIWSSQILF